MPTREEIRERVDKLLRLATGKSGLHLDAFKKELSELGVVIKVERELPKGTMTLVGGDNNALKVIDYLVQAGYVAVEELIKGA